MTTVSAIIPTYNRVESLTTVALPSIFAQTRPVDEIVIVGDGMEGDQLAALEDAIARLQDGRIKLFNIERPWYPGDAGSIWSIQGYAARNKGLDEATGEWVAPLDDDDTWTEDHVEVLLNAAIAEDTDFAYGKSITPWNQNYGHWPPSGMNFCDGAQVYKRSLGYRYDPECLKRWLPADADIWNRMVAGGVKFTFVQQLVHYYFPAER